MVHVHVGRDKYSSHQLRRLGIRLRRSKRSTEYEKCEEPTVTSSRDHQGILRFQACDISCRYSRTQLRVLIEGLGCTSGIGKRIPCWSATGYLAAEYASQSAASACGTPTCYLTLDHLGSTRMLTDSAGSSNVVRYDYLPFGGELLASVNGRTTAMGYGS